MADEFSFNLSLVVHDFNVMDLDKIIANVVREVSAALPSNVRIWDTPSSESDGVHSTCERGVCHLLKLRGN